MSVTHTPAAHAHRFHVNPWLVTVVALAAALVALAAWVVVDSTTGGDSATEQATALIDDFSAASSANDATAAMALATDDVVLWSAGDEIVGAKAWGDAIAGTATLTVERIAPVSVEGDYATTFARFAVPASGIDSTMIQVYQLEDGKIARLWQFVSGVTEPFDNALP